MFLFFFGSLQGRFTIAAKHHMSIAEIYETEMVDIDKVPKVKTSVTPTLSKKRQN